MEQFSNQPPFGVQPGGRIGRPKSGPGMERPEGYMPSSSGVDVLFGTSRYGGKPSVVSEDNPYKRTRMRGQSGSSIEKELTKAIQELAKKIPSAVPQ